MIINIAIIGGLNWFGKGMIDTTMHYKYFFNIIDNCSSPNSCKSCFGDIKHLEIENDLHYYGDLRTGIKDTQFVIFNISDNKNIMKTHEIQNLFFETCILCKEFDIKIIYSLDNDEFMNYYKNTIVNKIGCRYTSINHCSNIIGEMKVRDKIEEMIYLSIMNPVDVTNQDFNYTIIKKVIYTYLQALSIDAYAQFHINL
jgi:hypothetical protein